MRNSDVVDVICQHCKDGSVIPIKIRVQDDEQVNNVYTIKSYAELSSDKVKLPNESIITSDIIMFDCRIEVFGMAKQIILHFNKSQGKWYIYF